MAKNRVLAAASGVLLVGWFMFRHTIGFYNGVPAFFVWEDFVTFLLVLIFTPAVMWNARWTALGSVFVGVIRVMAGLYGLYTAVISLISKAWGPAVSVVLALVFTYFSFWAYQEK